MQHPNQKRTPESVVEMIEFWGTLTHNQRKSALERFGQFCADHGVPDVIKQHVGTNRAYTRFLEAPSFPSPEVLVGASGEGVVVRRLYVVDSIEKLKFYHQRNIFARHIAATSKSLSKTVLDRSAYRAHNVWVHENLHNVLDLPLAVEEAVVVSLAHKFLVAYGKHFDVWFPRTSLDHHLALAEIHHTSSLQLSEVKGRDCIDIFQSAAQQLHDLEPTVHFVPSFFNAQTFLTKKASFVNSAYFVEYNKYCLPLPVVEAALQPLSLEEALVLAKEAPKNVRGCVEYFAVAAKQPIPTIYTLLPYTSPFDVAAETLANHEQTLRS